MIVKELTLKNFLTHKNEEVEFPDEGIFLLSGESGAGKSSFLESIGFALYGYHATRAKTIEELKYKHAESDEEMSVTLKCKNVQGEEFIIERGLIGGDKNNSFVTVEAPDGTVYQGPANTKQILEDLLCGLDAKTFYMSFFAKQNELATISKMRGVERRKFIYHMLGIDLLEEISAKTSSNIRDLKAKAGVLQEQLGNQMSLEEMQNNLKTEEIELINSAAKAQQEAELLINVNARGKTKNEERNILAEQAEKMRSLVKEISFLKEEKVPQLKNFLIETKKKEKEIIKQKEILKENSGASNDLAEILKKLDKLTLEHQAILKKKELSDQITILDSEIKKIIIDPRDYDSEINDNNNKLNNYKADILSSDNKLKELNSNLELLEHEQICTTCLRTLDADEGKKVINNIKAEIIKKKEIKTAAEKNITKIEAMLSELKTAKDIKIKSQAELDAKTNELGNKKEEINSLPETTLDLDKFDTYKDGLDAKKQKAQDDLNLHEYADKFLKNNPLSENNYEEEIKITEEEIKVKEETLATLSIDKDLLDALEKEVADLVIERDNLNKESTTTALTLQNHLRNIKDLEKNILDREHNEVKIAAEEKNINDMNDLKVLFQDFKQKLSGQIRPQMEEITGEMFNVLSNGKFTNITIDENYEIYVEYNGETMPIRLLSGGEEERANLCLRVALTRLVSFRYGAPIRFIVLDEIFGGQDSGHRQLIIDSLEEIKNYYPQIFLVSHVGDLQDSEFINAIISFNKNKDERKAEVIIRA